ncbi:flagellar biosynthetic protein FliP [Planctomycetales bacterium]|nr:flagellar biosynthetic protein FliP [Planctomycetales bacterium]
MRRIIVLFLIVAGIGALSAAEDGTPQLGVPGPGAISTLPPITYSALDMSFLPTITDGGLGPADTPPKVASVLQIVFLLTVLTLAPSILLLGTCFMRILIVFSFFRRAIGTQTMPPDQMLVGIALVLTVFIMYPTWTKAWNDGLKPYLEEALDPATGQPMTQREMFWRMIEPHREFMAQCLEANNGIEELRFFMGVAGHQQEDENHNVYWLGENGRRVGQFEELTLADFPTMVLTPAFISAELKRAFWMGFLLYLPFLIMDMVISSVLMSMGMMMLPPMMVSMPLKIIMFILVDGWQLLLEGTVMSFPAGVRSFTPELLGMPTGSD